MHKFFKSVFFQFESVRILGESAYGGSEVAECLDAIGQIKDNDPHSWAKAWGTLAKEATAVAQMAEAKGLRDAARNAYLRASNYCRASGYMSIGSARFPPPDALENSLETRDLFLKAAQYFDHGFHVLEIPFEGLKIPAYLYVPNESSKHPSSNKHPVIINTGGADSVQEELYYMFPAEGPANGYAVLTFDGPGQGLMLNKYGQRMRPDWECVTTAVLDYLQDYAESYPDIGLDLDRVAVAGASLGGYFALRAAADPRIRACVAIDPFYDLWDFVTAHIGAALTNLWVTGWISNWFMNLLMAGASAAAFQLKWEISKSGQMFGKASPTEILLEMQRYSLKTRGGTCSYLEQVRCPVFVSGATDSLYIDDLDQHTMRVFKTLPADEVGMKQNELWLPDKGPGSGSLQAKMGALRMVNLKVYMFLDRVFGVKRDQLHAT